MLRTFPLETKSAQTGVDVSVRTLCNVHSDLFYGQIKCYLAFFVTRNRSACDSKHKIEVLFICLDIRSFCNFFTPGCHSFYKKYILFLC